MFGQEQESATIQESGQLIVDRQLTNLRQHPVPLDRVADRTGQQFAVHLALAQEVLSPLIDGFERHGLVIEAGQDENWNLWVPSVNGSVGLEPLAIREGEVEQHHIHFLGTLTYTFERPLERTGDLHRELIRRPVVQRLPHEARIARIVFYEQDAGSLCYQAIYWAGSLTISTQNSSIDLTTSRKWSMPTGFVT